MELRSKFEAYISCVKEWFPQRIPIFIGAMLAILFLSFQIHQLLLFNPFWGYDGGAHVQILETLLFQFRFPTLAENYLAWHEPLYYLILVGVGFLGIPFWFSHLVIVFVIDIFVFALFRRMGPGWIRSLFGSLAILSLPAFLEVSMFYTNEALNYVFLLFIMHCALTLWRESTWSWKSSLLFGLCVGLGVVTKITAVVAFGVVAILLIVKIVKTRMWKYGLTILGTIVLTMICYTPWYMVRSAGLAQASINNYDMLPAKELVWDERMIFMTRFDSDIFRFPFWYSGGTGFWSMIYADTVSDYLGLFENQDRKSSLSEDRRISTTHNGNSVSAYRKPFATLAIRFGLIPVGVMLIGFGYSVFLLFSRKHRIDKSVQMTSVQQLTPMSDALIVLGFSSAFLLALMYYAYRYPYYDQGVVKSIFIAPAFVLPMAMGMKVIEKFPRWLQMIIFSAWIVYIVIVLSLFFVRPM